jgi:hypothetical protein
LNLSCSDSENYQQTLITKLEKWEKEDKIQSIVVESEKNLYPNKKKWNLLFESKIEIVQPKFSRLGNYFVWSVQDTISIFDLSSKTFDTIKLPFAIEKYSISESSASGFILIRDKLKNSCSLLNWEYKNQKKLVTSNIITQIECDKNIGSNSNHDKGFLISENEISVIKLSNNSIKKIQISKNAFHPPFGNIKSKIHVISHGNGVFLFYGNYGSYFLYFFDGIDEKIYFIAKNIIKPSIYFDQKSHFFLISGFSGKINLLKFHDTSMNNLPILDESIELDKFNEPFVGSTIDSIYLFSKEKSILYNYKTNKRKNLPFLCNEMLGLIDGLPVCLQKKKEIWIRKNDFDEFDYRILNFYNKYFN